PLVLLIRPSSWRDPRRAFLLSWLLLGLVYFSLATNKLPGYVLPLLPAAAILAAVGLAESAHAGRWMALCAAMMGRYPIAARVFPAAIASGLSRASWTPFQWGWVAAAAIVASAILVLARRFGPPSAAAALAVAAVAGIFYLKSTALPDLNRQASARDL